jgi:hypothetical protein
MKYTDGYSHMFPGITPHREGSLTSSGWRAPGFVDTPDGRFIHEQLGLRAGECVYGLGRALHGADGSPCRGDPSMRVKLEQQVNETTIQPGQAITGNATRKHP